MAMVTTTHRWVRADLERLPDDGNRYEVLDGELFVTPQAEYEHQSIASCLSFALQLYCRDHQVGEVLGPGAVVFEDNELQPDLQVIPGSRESRRQADWRVLPASLLVIEILSPSTRQRDLGKKQEAYRRLQIPTYWIVDRDRRRVIAMAVGSADPEIVTDVLRWQPRSDLPPLEIPLEAIFGKPRGQR